MNKNYPDRVITIDRIIQTPELFFYRIEQKTEKGFHYYGIKETKEWQVTDYMIEESVEEKPIKILIPITNRFKILDL